MLLQYGDIPITIQFAGLSYSLSFLATFLLLFVMTSLASIVYDSHRTHTHTHKFGSPYALLFFVSSIRDLSLESTEVAPQCHEVQPTITILRKVRNSRKEVFQNSNSRNHQILHICMPFVWFCRICGAFWCTQCWEAQWGECKKTRGTDSERLHRLHKDYAKSP